MRFFNLFMFILLFVPEYAEAHSDTLHINKMDRRNILKTLERFTYTKAYNMCYTGVPLIVGGLIVNGEDDHFRNLRNYYTPSLRYHVDDYAQYFPAALMLGMKAFGVESRSSWGRMIASDAASAFLMFGSVMAMKFGFNVERPDGSAKNSFPSGHTATAFMTATMFHKEYGWRSPWYSIGAYSIAMATGISRQLNNRHWVSDIMVGAGIGVLSTEIGYYLTDLIFKDKGIKHHEIDDYEYSRDYRPSFVGLYAGLSKFQGTFELNDGRKLRFSAGSRVGVEGAYFFNPYFGLGGRTIGSIGEYMIDGILQEQTMRSTSFSVGPYVSYPISGRWAVGTKILASYNFLHNCDAKPKKESQPGIGSGVSLTFRSGSNISVRFFLDYAGSTTTLIKERYISSVTLGGCMGVTF